MACLISTKLYRPETFELQTFAMSWVTTASLNVLHGKIRCVLGLLGSPLIPWIALFIYSSILELLFIISMIGLYRSGHAHPFMLWGHIGIMLILLNNSTANRLYRVFSLAPTLMWWIDDMKLDRFAQCCLRDDISTWFNGSYTRIRILCYSNTISDNQMSFVWIYSMPLKYELTNPFLN